MAYEYRSETKYQTVPLTIVGGPCGSDVYGSRAVASVRVQSLSRDSRRKPADLVASMTSRDTQFTLVQSVRTETSYEMVNQTCGGVSLKVGRTSYSYVFPNAPGLSPPDYPDWAGPLRLKIQSDKVSFAEAIGEWKESAKLAGQSIGILVRAARAARSMYRSKRERRKLRKWFNYTFGRPPRSKLELMDAVSVDLCLKFGIEPNLTLLYDSIVQLGRIPRARSRFQVTIKDTRPIEIAGARGSLKLERTRSARAIAYVTWDLDSSEFTSGNLAEALWAGTRLSFMIDWFWNVGSYLSSFNALKGVKSLNGVVTYRCITTGEDRRHKATTTLKVPGRCMYRETRRELINANMLPYASIPVPELPEGDLGKLWSSIEVLLSLRRNSSV